MTSRLRLTASFAVAAALAFPLTLACSEDSSDGEPSGGAGGAQAGSGGGSTSGGAPAAGGAQGTGGFDPADALECGADAGASVCRQCMAVRCCDLYAECMRSEQCAATFEEYQTCVAGDTKSDSDCYTDFNLALSEGGPSAPLSLCVVTGPCMECGGPPPF